MFASWILIFILVPFHLSLSSVSEVGAAGRRQLRRRQLCADGTYEHQQRTCCLCPPGHHLKTHCSSTQDDRVCEPCGPERYSGHPNAELTCELCTSCSHVNANLELASPCTPARDAKCRCKEHHYCSSGTEENCKLCSPVEPNDGNNVGAVIGSVCAVAVVIALLVTGVVFWRKRRSRKEEANKEELPKVAENETEMQLIRQDVDLSPHMYDIVDELGWKDMKEVAMHSSIKEAVIDSCQMNHPRDSREQTIQLLRIWAENQGRDAPKNLVQILQKIGKRGKAEQVNEILSRN